MEKGNSESLEIIFSFYIRKSYGSILKTLVHIEKLLVYFLNLSIWGRIERTVRIDSRSEAIADSRWKTIHAARFVRALGERREGDLFEVRRWKLKQSRISIFRYYHIFRDGELEELLGGIDGCQLESITREQGNYIVIFRKV